MGIVVCIYEGIAAAPIVYECLDTRNEVWSTTQTKSIDPTATVNCHRTNKNTYTKTQSVKGAATWELRLPSTLP